MTSMPNVFRRTSPVSAIWAADASLTVATLLMLVALVVAVVGLLIDPRVITGAPAWLKPLKFAVSSALFTITIGLIRPFLTVWPRFVSFCCSVLAVVIVTEVLIIEVQAARGTPSHFNFSTPLNATLFLIMAFMIACLLLASTGFLVALFRQNIAANPAWGWALRLGMLITVLGASSGGFMTVPTAEQKAEMRVRQPRTIGAHTVGAQDGGPGLPGTGWSTRHGDLRIPHFFGLHGIQAVALFALWLRRRHALRTRTVVAFAATYFGLIALLTVQALRGESIAAPNPWTSAGLAVLAVSMTLIISLGGRANRLALQPLRSVIA